MRKDWDDLSTRERAALVVAGTVQLTLATLAWVDLARRPAELVRGPKWLWGMVIAVNFVGPILYFTVGRLREPAGGAVPQDA